MKFKRNSLKSFQLNLANQVGCDQVSLSSGDPAQGDKTSMSRAPVLKRPFHEDSKAGHRHVKLSPNGISPSLPAPSSISPHTNDQQENKLFSQELAPSETLFEDGGIKDEDLLVNVHAPETRRKYTHGCEDDKENVSPNIDDEWNLTDDERDNQMTNHHVQQSHVQPFVSGHEPQETTHQSMPMNNNRVAYNEDTTSTQQQHIHTSDTDHQTTEPIPFNLNEGLAQFKALAQDLIKDIQQFPKIVDKHIAFQEKMSARIAAYEQELKERDTWLSVQKKMVMDKFHSFH